MSRVNGYFPILLNNLFARKNIIFFFFLELIVLVSFEKSFEEFSFKKIAILFTAILIMIIFLGKKTHKNVFYIIATFGIMFSLMSPVFEIWDEPAHYTRAAYITEGHFGLSNEKKDHVVSDDIKVLEKVSRYTTRREKVLPNFFGTKLWNYTHEENKSYEFRVPITNAYSLLGYIPSSLGLFVGKIISNGNLGVMFYLGRIFNVLFYALCAMMAVKFALKWNKIVAFFSLQPMVIYISSSFNQDAFSYGLLLIIFGYFVNLLQKTEKSINFKNVLIYSGLCALMAFTKLPYITLAGLLIFIPKNKFKSTWTFMSGFVGILFVILTGIFWLLSYSKIIGNVPEPDVNMVEQLVYIMNNPQKTVQLVLTNLFGTINKYEQLSNFAWDRQYAPELALVNLSLLLMPLIYPIKRFKEIPKITKIGVFLVSLVTMTLIYLSMYLSWDSVGSDIITGVQGRYFFGVLLFAPIFMNFSSYIGYSGIEDNKAVEQENNLLVYIGVFLLIWAIAARVGVYY
ncbi:DUF2142 domain-containing protein [Carnobacterium mobile]|uniref:DUF2142 domain-containing protein n=1 Tax=Carnobacterium mobile TaxID=2750 RepID=UPI001868B5F6|nr:DUF2142 domain-containing protein [Carnobacterium mobile]